MLRAFVLGSGLLCCVPAAATAQWTGGVVGKSQMDDSVTIVYRRTARNTISAWPGKVLRPTMLVRCREGELDIYVDIGTTLNPEYGLYDSNSVRYRFDDASAVSEAWGESTDNDAYFVSSPKVFLARMMTAKVLRIEVTPFNSTPQVISFNVAGFGDARLKRLQSACKFTLNESHAEPFIRDTPLRKPSVRPNTGGGDDVALRNRCEATERGEPGWSPRGCRPTEALCASLQEQGVSYDPCSSPEERLSSGPMHIELDTSTSLFVNGLRISPRLVMTCQEGRPVALVWARTTLSVASGPVTVPVRWNNGAVEQMGWVQEHTDRDTRLTVWDTASFLDKMHQYQHFTIGLSINNVVEAVTFKLDADSMPKLEDLRKDCGKE